MGNNEENNDKMASKKDRAFRDGTKTEWDQKTLEELKNSMKAEMVEMATRSKQAAIAKMAARNDAIREPEQDQIKKQELKRAEIKEEMQRMAMKAKQDKIAKFAERGDSIRADVENGGSLEVIEPHSYDYNDFGDKEEVRETKKAEMEALNKQKAEEMKQEMLRIKQDQITKQTENKYNFASNRKRRLRSITS